MMGSPSAFFKLDAIMSGVQPEPSYGNISDALAWYITKG